MLKKPATQRILWLVLVADVCYLAVTFEPPKPPSKVTRENFDRIQNGMTEAEVKAILGPPGNYSTRPLTTLEHGLAFRRYWIGDEGIITICLDFPQEPGQARRVYSK